MVTLGVITAFWVKGMKRTITVTITIKKEAIKDKKSVGTHQDTHGTLLNDLFPLYKNNVR